MAVNLPDHQYAGDARNSFAFGGSGDGVIRISTKWGKESTGSINSEQRVFKALRSGYLSDFALTTTELDGNTVMTIDVGTQNDDDAFMAASTIGQTGGTDVAHVAHTNASGIKVAKGDYVIISVKAAATDPKDGQIDLAFRFTDSV